MNQEGIKQRTREKRPTKIQEEGKDMKKDSLGRNGGYKIMKKHKQELDKYQ